MHPLASLLVLQDTETLPAQERLALPYSSGAITLFSLNDTSAKLAKRSRGGLCSTNYTENFSALLWAVLHSELSTQGQKDSKTQTAGIQVSPIPTLAKPKIFGI